MSIVNSERANGIYPSKIREVTAKVTEAKKNGVIVSDFSIGRPDFDTPEHIKEAAIKALRDGQVHYTPSAGTVAYQEAVAYRIKEDYGITIDPSCVLATAGASQALYMTMQCMLNPGDEVLVPEPMYVYYGGLSFLAGGTVVPVPLSDDDKFIPTAEKLAAKITPKTKAILITSPNNPTGQIVDREEVLKIAALAKEHDLFVIADDIYYRIVYDNEKFTSLAMAPDMLDRTVIIGSFSKTYAMDGWRIGYVVVPKQVYPAFLKMQQHVVSCPNTFVQAGAVEALTGDQSCVDKMVAEFDRRRKLIMDTFDANNIKYVRPRGAFYIFPDFSELGMNSTDLAIYMLNEARIAVVPGGAFGPAGEGHLRLAFSTSYDDIAAGLERMMKAVEKLRNR